MCCTNPVRVLGVARVVADLQQGGVALGDREDRPGIVALASRPGMHAIDRLAAKLGLFNGAKLRHKVTPLGDGEERVVVTSSPGDILRADRVVFPGQGAARDCMKELKNHGLIEVVHEAAQSKPFLGICMGMQVLMESSEENDGVDCLGLYRGEVKSFKQAIDQDKERLKIKTSSMEPFQYL